MDQIPIPPADDELLWHYTGGVGLCGILGTGHAPHVTIWATSAEYLNDSEELRAGWRFYLGVLGEVSQRIQHEPLNPNNPHAEEGLQSRLSQVGQVQRLLTDALNDEETLDRSPYLSCFSLSKDQLSQWRGYATGGGFAIGFSRHKLESGVSVPESLTPVRYLADQAPAPAGVVEDIAKQFIHRSGAHGAVYASQRNCSEHSLARGRVQAPSISRGTRSSTHLSRLP